MGLLGFGKPFPDAFVDDKLVSSGLLMPSRKVVVVDELVEALAFVYRRQGVLGSVDHAFFQRRKDLATWQYRYRHA